MLIGIFLRVTYDLNEGYFLAKIHFYIGKASFLVLKNGNETVASEKYSYKAEDLNLSVRLALLPGNFLLFVDYYITAWLFQHNIIHILD